jgi:hypothetical protein
MTDQEIVLRTFAELQKIAAQYIEPTHRDAEITTQRMLSILDRRDVVAAAQRLAAGYHLREVQ